MTSLRERVEEAHRSDALKSKLLEDLLDNVDFLTAELEKSQAAAKASLDSLNKAKTEARDLHTSTECDKFILVLIDGDSMPFADDLVSRSADGGLEAGRKLRAAIQDYHRTNASYHPDDRVLIHVLANLRGLARASFQSNVTRQESSFGDFVAGFVASHPLTNFIDAGSHKEAADSKMKANMELVYRNLHCKHIIFGGSDNGYAGFLSQFANVSGVNARVTVLHEAHVPFWLGKAMKQFRSTTFQNVFRSSKLPTIPNNGINVVGTKRPLPDPVSPPHRRPSPPRHYSAGSGGRGGSRSGPSTPSPPSTFHTYDESPSVYINRYGQRLDSPIQYDLDFLQVLFEHTSRLCNNFYLKSYCSFGNNCQWDHSERLNQVQLDTLRHKARTSACRSPFCRDPECVLGHTCLRGRFCNVNQCKFLPEMHSIEMGEVYMLNTVTDEKTLVRSND